MKNRPTDLRPFMAIAKSMPTSIDILEGTLDAWAKEHARVTGLPVAKAYAAMLETDESARELYADLRIARRDPSVIAKRTQEFRKALSASRAEPCASDAERALDELADEYAKERSITKAAAYDEVLRTDAGRVLYAKHRAKRRAGRVSFPASSES